MVTLFVVSDVHYAGLAEQARHGFEPHVVRQPVLRSLGWVWRHSIGLRDLAAPNHRFGRFLDAAANADLVVANGDYSCDSAFIGVADDAACASAQECLGRLRGAFAGRCEAGIGDHELGKVSVYGGAGGLRWASWERTTRELGLPRCWARRIGRYGLLGVTSTLLALPVFAPELLPAEQPAWEQERAAHVAEIGAWFDRLAPDDRVLLFCHDPMALPFLYAEPAVRARLGQIDRTVVGHHHSPVIFTHVKWLAGLPIIRGLGHAARRWSTAMNQARLWREFRVQLCPSPSGVPLFKDGGYLRAQLDPDARWSARFVREGLA